MKTLILALIAAFTAAIKVNREDSDKIKELKTQNDDLIEKLRQEDLEDADIEELAPQIQEALNLATAARPPSAEQIAVVTGGAVSQDPAQPAGSPAPGNPEAEARMKEGKTEETEEETEEEVSKEDRIEALVNENTKEELHEKAEAAGLTVGSHDNKETIATAIVEKEDEGK